MEYIIICICVLIDIYEIIDFFKPVYKRKYFKNGYKLKLISPEWQYIVLFLAFLGTGYYLISFLMQKNIRNIIFFSMIFMAMMEELSKSYVIYCRDGLFLNGIYFSFEEKKEGQYIKKIILWNRRIYAIKTANKYAYVFLSKKYIDELTS